MYKKQEYVSRNLIELIPTTLQIIVLVILAFAPSINKHILKIVHYFDTYDKKLYIPKLTYPHDAIVHLKLGLGLLQN